MSQAYEVLYVSVKKMVEGCASTVTTSSGSSRGELDCECVLQEKVDMYTRARGCEVRRRREVMLVVAVD